MFVISQLTKALVDCCDGRLVGGDLGRVSRLLLLLRLQFRLLLGQFLLLLLSLLLNRSNTSLNVGSRLQVLAIRLAPICGDGHCHLRQCPASFAGFSPELLLPAADPAERLHLVAESDMLGKPNVSQVVTAA